MLTEEQKAQKDREDGSGKKTTTTINKQQRGNTMNFSQALDFIKEGKKVQRRGWNGKNMFVFLVPGSTFEVNRPPLLGIYKHGTVVNYHAHIDMRTASGEIVPWLASQSDF